MRRKSKWAIIISVIVAVIVLLGGIAVFGRLDQVETTKTVGSFGTYEVGKLDSSTGKGMTKSAIEDCDDYESYMHLREYINADGLKVKLADNATIEYKVYLFDDHYQLLGSTSWLDEDYTFAGHVTSATADAKYAMVEVIPTADPDGIISLTEITKYAKMLTVTYSKE